MTTEEDFFNRSVNDYEGYFSYASQDVLIEDLKSLVHDLENVSVYKKRSVSYNKELLAAYGLWVKGNSQGEIYPFLRNSSEYERVGQRTITRWVRWFKDIPQKDVELDRAGFYFHKTCVYICMRTCSILTLLKTVFFISKQRSINNV